MILLRNRMRHVKLRRPLIEEEYIETVVARFRELHLTGLGYKAFEHLPVGERSQAMAASRRRLSYMRIPEIKAAVKFLRAIGAFDSVKRSCPYTDDLVKVYGAMAKNCGWKVKHVEPGVIIVAAKLLLIPIRTHYAYLPEAQIGVDFQKYRFIHNLMVKHDLFDEPTEMLPLKAWDKTLRRSDELEAKTLEEHYRQFGTNPKYYEELDTNCDEDMRHAGDVEYVVEEDLTVPNDLDDYEDYDFVDEDGNELSDDEE